MGRNLFVSSMKNYLIYRHGGGFNSILAGVLGHLKICNDKGFRPYVDMKRYPGTYSETSPVHGTANMWEYYFEPVSELDENDFNFDQKSSFVDSEGRFPSEVINALFEGTPWLMDIYDRYITLKPESLQAISKAREVLNLSRNYLGVHFRGTDMRHEAYHPLPPSEKQMFRRIDNALNNHFFSGIYLVTDHEQYLRAFKKRYGSRIFSLSVQRSNDLDHFKIYPRNNHRYLLGLESQIETNLLAECGGLICGYSGVSEMAIELSRGNFRFLDKVWNGRNGGGLFARRHLWNYRNRAPRALGGFKR